MPLQTKLLRSSVIPTYPSESCTPLLIDYAIRDHTSFDWEMPTLTDLTAEEFRIVADKLPRE